ncbi:MAG: TerC family protein [Planctomycetaceae bacterium]
MSIFFESETWLSLLTLTAMEIVLGIDNVVFLSILASRLPPRQETLARRLGLGLALAGRLLLLFLVSWLMQLTRPLFTVFEHAFSGRDLILLGGGIFLIAKSTHEIFNRTEDEADRPRVASEPGAFAWVLAQILVLDIVFSLDSVITAVGMARDFSVMAVAMVVAVIVMLVFARGVSDFIHRHPSMKMLALAFLLLIGVMLVADGMGHHIPKGYIYFAMAFSLGVELLNLRYRSRVVHRAQPAGSPSA